MNHFKILFYLIHVTISEEDMTEYIKKFRCCVLYYNGDLNNHLACGKSKLQ